MISPNKAVGIIGTGSYLPDNILTNKDLEKMVETSDEWIVKRTGISERRILDKDIPSYEMGIIAANRALEDAGMSAEELDLIIVTTESPDYLVPSTACIIQGKIGASKAVAFDINAACTGFIYGLTIAKQFIDTGYYKNAIVIGVEGLSKITDWEDRNTCILFGDGAGAAILGQVEEGYGILGTYLGTDGKSGQCITLPCFHIDELDNERRKHENKRTVWMDGSEVFKFAVRIMESATLEVLDKSELSIENVDLLVPHQANTRIIDGAAKRLGISSEKVMVCVDKSGNISSASIPVAFDQAIKAGRVKKGDNIVLVGFGGGLTWGSAIIKWSK